MVNNLSPSDLGWPAPETISTPPQGTPSGLGWPTK